MSAKDLKQFKSLLQVLDSKINKKFRIEDFCFKEQIDFIKDPSNFKTAVCSRRAGKTIACISDLIFTAQEHPQVDCLYITLSRVNAKRIFWPQLLKLNREFQLGGHPNEAELTLKLPNGSVIYVTGAKDKTEIENFRGLAIKKAYIDESQGFRDYIRDLIDDVLSKALFDYNGTLCLIGTPGLIPSGYFYDCSKSKEWSHHHWTMFQNPYIEIKSGKSVKELIKSDCERMGVTIDHPKIRRECFGEWIVDTESLIFIYDKIKNDFNTLPEVPGKWEYIIGVDIGHDDADAIAVIGWNSKIKEAYLIEEFIKNKQGITELADQIEERIKKYDPLKVVMDTGGLGKKIAEELRKRRAIPIHAAEKSRKMEFIELLNDAMRTKRFFAKKESTFAQDCFLIEKDVDKSRTDKIIISDQYHSDICDAVLYAFREALHWTFEPEIPKPIKNSEEYWKKEAEEIEKKLQSDYEEKNTEDIWEKSSWEEWGV